MPDCFEAGTVNTHGIAALGAGLDYVSGIGVGKMQEIHTELWLYFTANARKINGITVYGPEDAGGGMINTGVVSLNLSLIHIYFSVPGTVYRKTYTFADASAAMLSYQGWAVNSDGVVQFEYKIDDGLWLPVETDFRADVY